MTFLAIEKSIYKVHLLYKDIEGDWVRLAGDDKWMRSTEDVNQKRNFGYDADCLWVCVCGVFVGSLVAFVCPGRWKKKMENESKKRREIGTQPLEKRSSI